MIEVALGQVKLPATRYYRRFMVLSWLHFSWDPDDKRTINGMDDAQLDRIAAAVFGGGTL